MKLRKRRVALISLIVVASFLFGTAVVVAPGNPVVELFNRISGIQENIESLQDQIDDLQASMPVAFPEPDYDSGWLNGFFPEGEDIILTHNLVSRDLFVYIYYTMTDPTIPDRAMHNIRTHNVYWFAQDYNTIKIGIGLMEPDYTHQGIRVLIWAIPD